jgi:hypothetical protein
VPTLRPLTEVARYDGRFFVEVVVPALRQAGFQAPIAIELAEPGFSWGNLDEAALVLQGSQAALDALLAGKQKTRLSALDKLRQQRSGEKGVESGAGIALRASASSLRELVRALRPDVEAKRGTSREVGAEASAPALRKRRDRVRTAEGRYIKGYRPDAEAETRAERSTGARPELAGAGSPPADRTTFALKNLARWVEAGLDHAADAGADEMLVLSPGGVQRV